MTEASQAPQAIVPVAKRDPIVVVDEIPMLDTAKFEHMQRIALVLARAGLVPKHLKGETPDEAIANCFLVVNQALRWRMDPFAVAQGTFVTQGKIGYEGKLVAAVINTHRNLAGRLSYAYTGTPGTPQRGVTVSGRLRGADADSSISGTVAQWRTSNEQWTKNPDQMLAYRGAREWARRWMPEAVLGVYADDEIEEVKLVGSSSAAPPEAPERPTKGVSGLATAISAEVPEAAEEPAPADDRVANEMEAEARAQMLADFHAVISESTDENELRGMPIPEPISVEVRKLIAARLEELHKGRPKAGKGEGR